MTDTETQPAGISVTPDKLKAKLAEIEAIDQQLDAALGSEQAGKRALGNQYAKDYESEWKELSDQVVEQINSVSDDPEKFAGVFNGVVSALNDAFKEKVDAFLADEVAANKATKAEISPEDVKLLEDSRKTNVDQYKALRGILELFGEDVSDIKEPKKRTGARGKRGPRVLQGFDFYVDGEKRTQHQNSLSSIANTITADKLGWKTNELKDFIASQGIDLEHPGDEFTVMLPDPVNKELRVVRREDMTPEELAAQAASEEDEDDEENGEDEEDNGTE